MDRMNTYPDIVISLLEEYADIKPANLPEVETMMMADRERNHYALVRMGWEGKRFTYHTVMHFDIKDGKVWLQQNWTDRDLAAELVERGIPSEDIVLGFVPPYARGQAGYAVGT